jgi:primosomal protein N' (replication factor Y)
MTLMTESAMLFPQLSQPPAGGAALASKSVGPFAGVALEAAIDKTLDYSIPRRLVGQVRVGQRVRVPLGRANKPALGWVVSIQPTSEYPKIKPLLGLEDERVLVSPPLMQLARWMSRYYVTPLGVVLESVIPSAVKKRIGLGHTSIVRPAMDAAGLQALLEKTRAPKRRAILARLLQVENGGSIELVRLASEAGVSTVTVRKLARLGVLAIAQETDLPKFSQASDGDTGGNGLEADLPLNPQQQAVFDELRPRVVDVGFSVNLLHGVTGSGKTEVYLQCIRLAVEAGRQAIVLVPEIALTPQTVRRFTARFPRVAVLHSGLTATDRHRHWQRLSAGEADVVVGARSAVFAPVPRLGIIVVDEEHDASYKQDTAPRYQGRDVAVKRAQLEGVPIVLGSATPSLESYYRVTKESVVSGPSSVAREDASRVADSSSFTTDHGLRTTDSSYHLLTLANRVRGLSLPHIELIDMRRENKYRRGVHLLSQRLEQLLRTTVDGGHQAILLLNRRGYSNFVYCASCTNAIQCKYCDTTMTYHRSTGSDVRSARLEAGLHSGQLHCHYCLAVNTLPDKCPHCGKKLILFGLGTQRVEEEIARKFPDVRFARMDSDSMRSGKDYAQVLARFASGEVQVLLGTQMITKGLDYPNVTLVGVVSGDTALALPDFRAGERTFQLITQVAGRAGRGATPGRVVLQTFLPDDPAIRLAMKQDFVPFATQELKQRRAVGLPPISRMVRIVLRDLEPAKLHHLGETLAAAVNAAVIGLGRAGERVRVRGPMPCAINRIAGYHRHQILLQCNTTGPLQAVLAAVRAEKALAKNDRIAVDVDPVSLL